MEGYGTWYGHGSAVPTNPDLDGTTSLFDSPLPELHEVNFGDDLGLALDDELFEGDLGSVPFDYSQESFPPASSGPDVGAFDVNAQLAACFDFDDPLLYPDTDMDLGLDLGLDVMDFNFFPSGLTPGSQLTSSVDTSPFSRLSDTSAFTAATSPASPHEAGAALPYRCTTDDCTKTFRKESQLKYALPSPPFPPFRERSRLTISPLGSISECTRRLSSAPSAASSGRWSTSSPRCAISSATCRRATATSPSAPTSGPRRASAPPPAASTAAGATTCRGTTRASTEGSSSGGRASPRSYEAEAGLFVLYQRGVHHFLIQVSRVE